MYEDYIQNFLNKSDPSCADRHSDSSDFETPTKIPAVTAKRSHKFLRSRKNKLMQERESFHSQRWIDSEKVRSRETYKKRKLDNHIDKNRYNDLMAEIYNDRQNTSFSIKRSDGDIYYSQRLENNNKNCLPSKLTHYVVEESNYSNHKMERKNEESGKHGKSNNDKLIFCKNNPMSLKKIKHGSENYTLRPIYIVERNGNNIIRPFGGDKNKISQSYSERENSSMSFLESERELQIRLNNDHKEISLIGSNLIENQDNNGYVDNRNKERNEDKTQQFPSKSKFGAGALYHIYKASCKSQSISTDSKETNKLSSSSSAFWTFLANKVHRKCTRNAICERDCECCDSNVACNRDNCRKLDKNLENYDIISKKLSHCSNKHVPLKLPEERILENHCKCVTTGHAKSSNNGNKPCQEAHSDVAKAIAAKYKGEILCIHNPPCILINGCLNMPTAKHTLQTNVYPVTTQTKKHSFSQICKKMKRSKHKNCDQSSQYQPPYTQIEEYLPEFRLAKNIRSLCSHVPPCQVVHSCFGAKHHTKFVYSCVQMPVHRNIPKSYLDIEESKTRICDQNLKCRELFDSKIDAKKYFILNFEKNTSKTKSKVKPKSKSKTRCQHKPPCLSIPRCIANLISNNYVPVNAEPDCIHHPTCEMVPACHCAHDKNMMSAALQCSY